MGILLIVGGITLYRTFALYEDKKEFNILQGKIPDFRNYTEEILNGADPVLAEGLIPVEIDNKGKVTKADLRDKWYSYEEKRWANAVILEDENITYQDGEEIPESNIESYFVWIPKYSYQLWDLGNYSSLTSVDTNKVHEIPIKFGLNNTSDTNVGECTTPMNEEKTQGLSGETGNCKIGDYMTPSAFITMGTNGLWVGKFETGNKSITNESNSVLNKNDSTKVQIKPNVYSWRGIQVANAYLTSYNYKREYDSHMMKNTEWGVVAYLQHSKYGSALRVRINNNAAYITGYAAIREGVDIQKTSLKEDGTYTKNYKNPLSQVASTTGNYSGIYDMNGGATEYVMGVMLNKSNTRPLSGKNNIYNSGFNGVYAEGGSLTTGVAFPETKYYDCYVYNDSNNMYIRGIMGDATKELGGFGKNNISSWYENKVLLTISSSPWFVRGSRSSSDLDVGIFTSNAFWGNNYSLNTFRIVLAIK